MRFQRDSMLMADFDSTCPINANDDYLTVLDKLNGFFAIDSDLETSYNGYCFSDLSCKKSGDLVSLAGTVYVAEIETCLNKFVHRPIDDLITARDAAYKKIGASIMPFLLLASVEFLYKVLRDCKTKENMETTFRLLERYMGTLNECSDYPFLPELMQSIEMSEYSEPLHRVILDTIASADAMYKVFLLPVVTMYFNLFMKGFYFTSPVYDERWLEK